MATNKLLIKYLFIFVGLVIVIKMIVAVLFFLCGILQIMGRPSVGSNNVDNVKFEEIPPWLSTTDTYLLPRKLNVDDTINITVFIKHTPVLNITLITASSTSNSKRVLCTLMADKNSGNVIFISETGEHVIEQNQIENFYHEDDETTFKVSFKRRAHSGSDHKTALQIKSTTFSDILSIPDEDDLRLLKFSGNQIKVSEMAFKFA